MMKVVHLVPNCFGRERGIAGGAERYAFELARHMAARTPTRLVSFEAEPRRETCGPLEIRTLRPAFQVGSRGNPFSLRLLRELAWADVVHCHQYKTCIGSLAALYARATGRRVFASDLGGAGLDISSVVSTDGWFHGHLHISRYSRFLAGHDHRRNAGVIYGGVSSDRFYPDESVARDGSVLFVGRLLPHKGVDVLIRALPQGMRLVLVGQEADPEYLALLKKQATGKPVEFVRDANDDALARYYRRALCIVLPSVHRTVSGRQVRAPELLGQTLLEGMACQAPGVCSDAASLPEIVRDGRTGFIVPWGDAAALHDRLSWLRDHPDAARRMGVAAEADVRRRFGWPAAVDRCLQMYADGRITAEEPRAVVETGSPLPLPRDVE